MKIIQVMPEFGIAGAEIMCENLTYELIKLGHEVVVISMYDYHSAITDRLEKAGVDIRYLGKKTGPDFSMLWKMRRVFKETCTEVVHTHLYCAEYAVPAAMMAGVKCRVHTVHNIAEKENKWLARKLNKFFFRHCGLTPVALSETIRASIACEYGIKNSLIPIIYNGIDLSSCVPKTNYTQNGNFKILHIGRFSKQKNHFALVKAFKLFHDKYSDSELWLIGEGELKPEIEEYVKVNELDDYVKFLGLQSNVYGYLHDADVFTLPSNYEGVPMTLIEAMGTGLPIVATAVGGVPDMLDYNSAVLVKPDENAISSAFEEYYIFTDKRIEHGKAAKERSDDFSSLKMCKNYLKIYSKKL